MPRGTMMSGTGGRSCCRKSGVAEGWVGSDNGTNLGASGGIDRPDQGPRPPGRPISAGAHGPEQHALLRMQAVFRLVEDHALRTVDHLGRDFLAAMGRQAVLEDG